MMEPEPFDFDRPVVVSRDGSHTELADWVDQADTRSPRTTPPPRTVAGQARELLRTLDAILLIVTAVAAVCAPAVVIAVWRALL